MAKQKKAVDQFHLLLEIDTTKSGWYVNIKVTDPDLGPKPTHGPFTKEDCEKACKELYKDLGRSLDLQCISVQVKKRRSKSEKSTTNNSTKRNRCTRRKVRRSSTKRTKSS